MTKYLTYIYLWNTVIYKTLHLDRRVTFPMTALGSTLLIWSHYQSEVRINTLYRFTHLLRNKYLMIVQQPISMLYTTQCSRVLIQHNASPLDHHSTNQIIIILPAIQSTTEDIPASWSSLNTCTFRSVDKLPTWDIVELYLFLLPTTCVSVLGHSSRSRVVGRSRTANKLPQTPYCHNLPVVHGQTMVRSVRGVD